ncbi:MAG: winged helix DNA-binding protein [Winogradskyella sp.]|uniref:MarR family winged helix-turn-helix transcriptional regulator n=1 Tax=Winogradskyella sp. TaxID=1883156 RepID=UPI0025D5484E|nr:MarR family transcriptional regulator [Winogradskyella sp.]NRB61009.1 winged helix DNA-binding protein [Winogradskyella sp.]
MKIETLIKLLVDEAIKYKLEVNSDISLESYMEFLRNKDHKQEYRKILKLQEEEINQEIIVHLARLNRYANLYLKDALKQTGFSTDMEFPFTAIIHQYGPLSKMELIRKMVYEKSSGMQIINRLIEKNIFTQIDNPNDKRSKLIKLTNKGEQEIFRAYNNARPAAKVVSFPLNELEKKQLIKILNKLDDYHLNNYLDNKFDATDILE